VDILQKVMAHPLSFREGKFIEHVMKSFALFFLVTVPAMAQNIYNETNLFIAAGLEVSTKGSLINTGFFQNNGSVALAGDWNNTNIYQGTGMVALKGIDQLLFNNNQPVQQLIISGGGTKTLQGKLTVSRKIDFNEGVLLVGDNDMLFIHRAATINGGSLLSFVDGALTIAGTGYKFFPIGKNGKYHPVELVGVNGLNPEIEMEVFENLPQIQTSLPAIIHQDIYWTRKTIDGTFYGSPITLGYSVPSQTNLARLVIAEAESLVNEFSLHDGVAVQSGNGFDIVSSRKDIKGNIFALGELINDPPRPYYFSTTLSPLAENPENRSVKIFGGNGTALAFYFQVFNRWGLQIFETKSYRQMATEGWDGKQSGSLIDPGLYPYSLKYIDQSGKALEDKGFITVIR